MTPDGLKSGSSVVEVSYQKSLGLLPDSRGKHVDSLRGEAVYVDLGGGKNLFVTLGSLYSNRPSLGWLHVNPFREPDEYKKMSGSLDPIWLPIKLFRLGRSEGKELEMCTRVSSLYGSAPETVDLNNLPTLVTFTDLLRPETARAVNPYDLSTNFGVGYSLVAKIEVSNAPITQTIETILPWLLEQTTGRYVRPTNWLAAWEFYKFTEQAQHEYILQQTNN